MTLQQHPSGVRIGPIPLSDVAEHEACILVAQANTKLLTFIAWHLFNKKYPVHVNTVC